MTCQSQARTHEELEAQASGDFFLTQFLPSRIRRGRLSAVRRILGDILCLVVQLDGTRCRWTRERFLQRR